MLISIFLHNNHQILFHPILLSQRKPMFYAIWSNGDTVTLLYDFMYMFYFYSMLCVFMCGVRYAHMVHKHNYQP